MTRKKLKKLKRQLASLRNRVGNLKSQELEKFARSLGRKLHKRGKEPTWISELLPNSKPISIPHHSGNLNKYTAGNILDQFEQDIFQLEDQITE